MAVYFARQPLVERRPVNPPAPADLEAGQLAALYQAIDGSGMHAQYIGDLGDSENTTEFPMLDPTPFQRLTDLRSRGLNFPEKPPAFVNRSSPNRKTVGANVTLFQIFRGADVRRDSPRAKLRCKLTLNRTEG